MNTEPFEHQLRAIAGDRVERDAPLAQFTTFGIGGPADWLVEIRSVDELVAVVTIARESDARVTPLGGGSNVLIADAGIRGVVLRLKLAGIGQVNDATVRADSGVTMNGLVRWTIAHGLAGLEAWAGTPGTVGGAVYGNAHYGGRNIGELIARIQVLSCDWSGVARAESKTPVAAGLQACGPSGGLKPAGYGLRGALGEIDVSDMEFAYDSSRLQRTHEILVSADFHVGAGDPGRLREIAKQSLAHRKRTQPLALPSAGCIFQNPDPARDVLPPGVPASAGALIDRAGLKGHRIGGARISSTHANFIVNEGGATAHDVRTLIDEAHRAVRARFGVDLREEIVCLGDF